MLYKYCFLFLLGRLKYPGETGNKGYAKVYYGRCANGECIDNHELKTLWTKCSREKGAAPGQSVTSKQPFSISKHKAFYSGGRRYGEFEKINGLVEFHKRFLVGNVGIAPIPCRLTC